MSKVYLVEGYSMNPEDGVFIGEADTTNETWNILDRKVKDMGENSYYKRMSMLPEQLTFWVDYGSHSKFFLIVCDTKKEFGEFMKNG